MSRRPLLACILIVLSIASAHSRENPFLDTPMPAPEALPGEALMPEAQRAFQQGNAAALQRLQKELGSSPLRVWVDHWAIRLELQSDTGVRSTARIQEFERTWKGHPLASRLWALWAEREIRGRLDANQGFDDILASIDARVESTGLRCARAAPNDQSTLEANLADGICRQLLVVRSTGLGLTEAERTRLARSLAFQRNTKTAIDLWSRAPSNSAGLSPSEERLLQWLATLSKSLKDAEQAHRRGLRLNPEQAKAAEFALGARGWLRSDDDAASRIQKSMAAAPTMPTELLESASRQLLREGDHPNVLRLIAAMPEHARNDETWRFWRARLGLLQAQAQGQPTTAFLEDLSLLTGELSFYSLLASDILQRQSVAHRLVAEAPQAQPPNPRLLKSLRQDPSVRRAMALSRQALRAEAAAEWRGVIEGRNDAELVALAALAMAAQAPDRAVVAASRSADPAATRLRFPAPFQGALAKAFHALAPSHIDEPWVYGVIRQESRFLVDVKSSANAQGLMQLIPPTAQATARKVGLDRFVLADLADPTTNLRLGTHYLEGLAQRFNGSRVLATAGYNAGPHRSKTWRARLSQPTDGAAFVESIPFKETRDYVKAVSLNAVVYGGLLAGASGPSRSGKPGPVPMLTEWLGTIDPPSGNDDSDPN